jgi:putative colanic acid biosynthesis acetyltransferase WcaF
MPRLEEQERKIDLSSYESGYWPGRNILVQCAWFFCGAPLFRCNCLPGSNWRRALLRLFGASVASGVVLKPGVRIKYPWQLTIGRHAWIGEECWIDNLGPVTIGNNACVSQGAYLCTGNHNWSDPAFGLEVRGITLADGAWVGARSVVCPGVEIQECGVAAAGSVVTQGIPSYEIHAGNPARFSRKRSILPCTGPLASTISPTVALQVQNDSKE